MLNLPSFRVERDVKNFSLSSYHRAEIIIFFYFLFFLQLNIILIVANEEEDEKVNHDRREQHSLKTKFHHIQQLQK